MPVPLQYSAAGTQFQQLLRDARDFAGLTTTNQSFTMVEGVLLAFRRRVSVLDGLRFADVLPAVARAIFLHRWDPDTTRAPFGGRSDWTADAQALRREHNDAPDTCVSNVAAALRRNVDSRSFDRCLERLGPSAVEFWTPSEVDRAREVLEHPFPGPLWMTPVAGRPGSDRRPAHRD